MRHLWIPTGRSANAKVKGMWRGCGGKPQPREPPAAVRTARVTVPLTSALTSPIGRAAAAPAESAFSRGMQYDPKAMCYAKYMGWACTGPCVRHSMDGHSPGATGTCRGVHDCRHDHGGWLQLRYAASNRAIANVILAGETEAKARARRRQTPGNARFCKHFYNMADRAVDKAFKPKAKKRRGEAAAPAAVACTRCAEVRRDKAAQTVSKGISEHAATSTGWTVGEMACAACVKVKKREDIKKRKAPEPVAAAPPMPTGASPAKTTDSLVVRAGKQAKFLAAAQAENGDLRKINADLQETVLDLTLAKADLADKLVLSQEMCSNLQEMCCDLHENETLKIHDADAKGDWSKLIEDVAVVTAMESDVARRCVAARPAFTLPPQDLVCDSHPRKPTVVTRGVKCASKHTVLIEG